jgi:hypothetical protein
MSLKVYKPPRLPSSLPAKVVTMKQEIDINVAALKAYDEQDYPTALQTFSVSPLSRLGMLLMHRKSPTRPRSSSIWE